jgi:predicted NBD/HSP70 family sugar kinase
LNPQSAAEAVRAIASQQHLDTLGIAVRNPLDPTIATVIEAAARASGVTAPPKIVTRGTAFALGEHWCGAAKGADHVVALSIGEGVHAGIVLKGRPFEGAHGLAGLAGWLSLNPVERDDYRRQGCLEAETGAPGIVRRLVWRLKAGDTSSVLEKARGDISSITVRQIFEAAQEGDGVAGAVVRDTARYIGMAVGNLIAVVDPDVVVLGGLIGESYDPLIELVRLDAARRVHAAIAASLTILPSALGENAVALGAARAALLAQ